MRTRIFTLLVAFLAIAGNAVWGQETTKPSDMSGDGTITSPYELNSKEDLEWFRDLVNGGDADACAKLTADIDLESEEWEPIGYADGTNLKYSYTGTFDGDGHTISGICIGEDSQSVSSGLFRVIGVLDLMTIGSSTPQQGDGTVKNLTIKGTVSTSLKYTGSIGGICGFNIGTIQNCTSYISFEEPVWGAAGGICSNNYGVITNCINEGDITSNGYSGGICGLNSGQIKICYNSGSISAIAGTGFGVAVAGGITGHLGLNGSIENCYNVGAITGHDMASGICCIIPGTIEDVDVDIKNCHNYGTIESNNSKIGGIFGISDSYETRVTVDVENSYYINTIKSTEDEAEGAEPKSAKAFANGEVLYLLQQNNPDVWVQTIGMDDYPKFETEGEGSTVYQVTVQPNDAAMGTTTGGGVYVANEEATVTATPNDGYEFINWTIGEEEQSTETTYTFEVTASVTLIANFQKIDEGGEEEPGDDDQGDTGIHKPQRPIKYYNIYIDTICPGLDVEVSKDVVQEGHQVSAYLTIQSECDTTGMRFEYKRGLFGYWKDLKELEGVQPGEYIIKNIYTDIYIRALDATLPEEEPTGIEDLEGVKAYAKDGSIYVYTPSREEVMIIGMSGAIIKHEEQVGLQSYNVSRGIYIVRIGEKVFKLKN